MDICKESLDTLSDMLDGSNEDFLMGIAIIETNLHDPNMIEFLRIKARDSGIYGELAKFDWRNHWTYQELMKKNHIPNLPLLDNTDITWKTLIDAL